MNTVLTRVPVRIPLAGGGTDLPLYSSRFGGFLLSAAINKYVYVLANRPQMTDTIRVKTSVEQEVTCLDEIKYDVARESLRYCGIKNNIQVTFEGDVPHGTGLGTSGSYTVGLIKAFSALKGKILTSQEIAEAACYVEMEMLKLPVGKQDQYMAAFGGVRILKISTEGRVDVENPQISWHTLDNLRGSMLFFFTGQRHDSNKILGAQKILVDSGNQELLNYYHKIKSIGLDILEALQRGDLIAFGELLHQHWLTKRNLAGGVTNPAIDRLYDLAMADGALGGKIMGSGGGGFFMFFCRPGRQEELRATMQKQGLRELSFDYDFTGATVVYASQ